jgi:hypothetical protein
MSLTQKFKDAVLGAIVRVSSLRLKTRYPVMHAKRVETRHGMRVVMTLLEEDDNVISLFLPKRYGDSTEDTDITDINTRRL